MSWNGSGVVSWTYTWVNDASADIKILASRQDAQWADAKTTIQNTITRDGQNTPSANLPMAGYKHTGVAAGSARTEYASIGNVQDGTGIYVATDSGTASAYVIAPSVAITAYAAGNRFWFKATNTNSAAPTIAVSGLATKTITDAEGDPLSAAAIKADALVEVVYDGTNFRLVAGGQKVASPVSRAKLFFYGQL